MDDDFVVEGSEFMLDYFDGEDDGVVKTEWTLEEVETGEKETPSQSTHAEEENPKDGEEELDAKAWLKRRREQIARASRKARQKRRAKVDELQKENDRLRIERATFLKKIEDLQEKVDELRNCGQMDVKLENELLKAQLEEHKRFLSGCFKLHHGIPSSEKTMQSLHEQGSSFAETFVHSLMSRSSHESWESTKMNQNFFQHLKPGYNIKSMHKVISSPSHCLHARLDIVLTGVSIDTVQDVYWALWTDPDTVRKLYGINYPFQLTPLALPVPEELNQNFGTMCYVEKMAPLEQDREWVFLVSKKRQTLAKSTLNIGKEQTPGLCRGLAPDGSKEPRFSVESKRKKRRKAGGQKKEAALGTFGKAPAWVLARSTTQHVPKDASDGIQRITGLVIEGAVVWEQGIIDEDEDLEASFMDADDNEQLVEREMCTRLAVLVSIPQKVGFGILGGYNDIVDETGTFSQKWSAVFDDLYKNCVDLEAKKKLAQQEDHLVKCYHKAIGVKTETSE